MLSRQALDRIRAEGLPVDKVALLSLADHLARTAQQLAEWLDHYERNYGNGCCVCLDARQWLRPQPLPGQTGGEG